MSWYVIYQDTDGTKDVISIFDTDADTRERAIKEALYSLNILCPFKGKIIYVTSDETDEKLLDYDLITEADAETVVDNNQGKVSAKS